MNCPRCGAGNAAEAVECARCGVILAKATRARQYAMDQDAAPPPVIEMERVADGRIGRAEMVVLGSGLAGAVIAYAIPFTRAVFSALITLFHELGHAVAGWILGYPSLPAFDLVYGGGLTHHGAFRPSIAVAIAGIFAWLAWLFRENRKTQALVVAVSLIWLFVVTREWRREIVFAAAGHLSEFILAGILFYKALAGVGWRSPELERPLGAFIAFFVQIHATVYAWRLVHDETFRELYRRGKGGAMMNDLEVVALDLQIWLGVTPQIEGVARWLLVFSALPIVVALVWYFERARWHRVLRALRTAS